MATAERPTLQSSEAPSYYSWHVAEEVPNLACCKSLERAERVTRLRPEGYAHLDTERRRIYPIHVSNHMPADDLLLPCAGAVLRVPKWIDMAGAPPMGPMGACTPATAGSVSSLAARPSGP